MSMSNCMAVSARRLVNNFTVFRYFSNKKAITLNDRNSLRIYNNSTTVQNSSKVLVRFCIYLKKLKSTINKIAV